MFISGATVITPPHTYTFNNLKELVHMSLEKKTDSRVNLNIIGDFINAGYQNIARMTHGCRVNIDIDISASGNELDLTEYKVLCVNHFHIVNSDGAYKPLERITYGDYLGAMERTLVEDIPHYFARTPTDYLYIHPVPSIAYTGYAEIAFVPPKMTDDDDESYLPDSLSLYYWAAVEMKRILGESFESLLLDRERAIGTMRQQYKKYPNFVKP